MKPRKIALVCTPLVAFCSPLAVAQDATQQTKSPQTKLETFLAKKGTLLVSDIQLEASIKGPQGDNSALNISAEAAYEPGQEANKTKGLRCFATKAHLKATNDNRLAFVDMEEARGLSTALGYLADAEKRANGQKMDNGSERRVCYHTKDDFEVGFTVYKGQTDSYVRVGRVGEVNTVYIRWESADALVSMKEAVDKGIEWAKKP